MTREAWYCPACKAHHAPHCDTCPEAGKASVKPAPTGIYRNPPHYTPNNPRSPVIGGTAGNPKDNFILVGDFGNLLVRKQ